MLEKSLHKITPYLIVPTMLDRRTRASSDALQKMKGLHRYRVRGSVISIDTRFRDASKAGQPLSRYAPRSRDSQAYLELLNFLLGMDQRRRSEEASDARGIA